MPLSWSRLYWEDQKLQSLPTSADIDADPPLSSIYLYAF